MKPLLSIVTPAFNEATNLPELYRRFVASLEGINWEWIAVDDHSDDDTFAVISELAMSDPRIRGIRLAKKSGSHAAVLCGLTQVRGDAAAFPAADLQDPPEILPKLLGLWREGAQIVWAVRSGSSPDQDILERLLSGLYYKVLKFTAEQGKVPPEHVGFSLIDRKVIDALESVSEYRDNVFLRLARMSFRQASLSYQQQPRYSGRSGWTLKKKIELALASVWTLSRSSQSQMAATAEPNRPSPYQVEKTTGDICA